VLPNHYHSLVGTDCLPQLLLDLGRLHGRTAFEWNGEDGRRGRKVWFNCVETAIKSERHFWATLNYIHHNPVHHRYVAHWQDWPFSSAAEYLESRGSGESFQCWITGRIGIRRGCER
jgi:putative transposase